MTLPAVARRRWALEEGGPVDVLDLGFGVLTVPEGHASHLLDDFVSAADHTTFVDALEHDPDLATT